MARLLRVIEGIGAITSLFSFAFIVPFLVSFAYDTYDVHWGSISLPSNALIFLFCGVASFTIGYAMQALKEGDTDDLRDQDAFLTVGVGWLWLTAVAMMPFLLSGTIASPVDAFFEAMSGMTTTGATILDGDLEAVDPSVMLWRGFLQYLGGMGIVVLSIALLAKLTQGGLQMLQAETPGPSVTRIAPRLAQTARILWSIYLSFSAALFVILCIAIGRLGFTFKQTIYEAMLHTFTTMATGGFSNHNESISYFNDVWVEGIIVFFMLLSGTSYALHYRVLRGDRLAIFRDVEWRFYVTTFLVASGAMTLLIWRAGADPWEALRGAVFTTASFITSSGFTTADYDVWPEATKIFILLLMVTGATAGSTSGGIKHIRVLLLAKVLQQQFLRIIHPRAVVDVQLGHQVIRTRTLMTLAAFFATFMVAWGAGTGLLLAFEPTMTKPLDAASASVAALGNMGPALGVVGPTQTYAPLNDFSTMTLSILMWFGRLELFTALLVFTPNAWRH